MTYECVDGHGGLPDFFLMAVKRIVRRFASLACDMNWILTRVVGAMDDFSIIER